MSGYRVDKEKPNGRTPEEIHAAIGENGDDSLFAWVVQAYRSGTLLCDDGPGEVADFLHIDDNGTLSLISRHTCPCTDLDRRLRRAPARRHRSRRHRSRRHRDSRYVRPAARRDGVSCTQRESRRGVSLGRRPSACRTASPRAQGATHAARPLAV
jgi:hypothetical protein